MSKIEIKGEVEGLEKSVVTEKGQEKGGLKVVSQEKSEVKEDGHKKSKDTFRRRVKQS